jgi:ATP-dependent protease ClpP protease subunit
MLKPLHIAFAEGKAEIHVRGYIGAEEADPATIVHQLDLVPNVNEVAVYINSGGGSVDAGNEIAAALKRHPARKTAYVVGTCGSMATMIALACDTIKMHTLAQWMVHMPITGMRGRSEDLAAGALAAKAYEDEFVRIYTKRTGMAEDAMRALLKEERWMGAEEAKRLGFVDEVVNLTMDAFYGRSATTTPKPQPPTTMTKVAFALGLTPDATEDQTASAAAELRTKLAAAEERAQKAEAALAAQQAAALQAEAESLIATAIKEGRITEANAPIWREAAGANLELTRKQIAALAPQAHNPILRSIQANAATATVSEAEANLMQPLPLTASDAKHLEHFSQLLREGLYNTFKATHPEAAARMTEANNKAKPGTIRKA